jgi:hypothetical protein
MEMVGSHGILPIVSMGTELNNLVKQAIDAVPLAEVMGWLEDVARHDRFQASYGILRAAEVVAVAARAIGLCDVRINHFEADGAARAWSFQSPRSWTPLQARLSVGDAIGGADSDAGGNNLLLDHAEQPFLLATNSAPTPDGGVFARLARQTDPDLNGCIVVLGSVSFEPDSAFRNLNERGAVGFITAAKSCIDLTGHGYSGRVELDSDTPLFGFSVTPAQHRMLWDCAGRGIQAHALVQIDRSAPMPVVTAVLAPSSLHNGPSHCDEDGALWLTAHLCHPRPSANDNASGVAGLLGTAATLQRLAKLGGKWSQRQHAIRFVWAPEFVGTATALHTHLLLHGARAWPRAVLNLDMIGEDQAQCSCPFVVERSPESIDSVMGPLAESIVESIFSQTATQFGQWRAVPFLGYSDHALFAGPYMACPAVQLTHWPDRFNHSAADTLDKVSPLEMRRSIAAASVLAHCVADDFRPVREAIPGIIDAWCRNEETATKRLAGSVAKGRPGWASSLMRHVRSRSAHLREALLTTGHGCGSPGVVRSGMQHYIVASPFKHTAEWIGPLNLRDIIQRLPAAHQSELTARIRKDKQILAVLGNFYVRSTGSLSAEEITLQTSFALGRPLDRDLTEMLWVALFSSGWIMWDNGVADAKVKVPLARFLKLPKTMGSGLNPKQL